MHTSAFALAGLSMSAPTGAVADLTKRRLGAAGLGVSGSVAGIFMKPDLGSLCAAPFSVDDDLYHLCMEKE